MSAVAHRPPQSSAAGAAPDGDAAREKIVWIIMDELSPGMFVHPLSSASFLIARAEQIHQLRESGVHGIFVDLAKSSPHSLPQWARHMAGICTKATLARQAPAVQADTRAAAYDQAGQVLGRAKAPMERLLRQARLGKALGTPEVIDLVGEISKSVEQNETAIISLARIKSADSFTYLHSLAVCALMVNLARHLDLAPGDVQELGIAGLLHDVGKMAIDAEILNKPGSLTPQQMTIMRGHAEAGYEMLKRGGNFPASALDVALHHHEKMDGTGYPHKLVGEAISQPARMAAICDVYDAVTSRRPYKEAWLPAECLVDMYNWKGHFDPGLLQTFIRSVGIYPVGSLVRLASDRLALVMEQNAADLTKPVVRIFYSISQRSKVTIADLVLAKETYDSIVSREDPRKWGFADWDRQWPKMIRLP